MTDQAPSERLVVKLFSILGCRSRIILVSKDLHLILTAYRRRQLQFNKTSPGDEIANVNFYAVRPEAGRIR